MRALVILCLLTAVASANRPSPVIRPIDERIIGIVHKDDGTTELRVAYRHYRWALDMKHWRAALVVDGRVLDCVPLTITRIGKFDVTVTARVGIPGAPEVVRFEPGSDSYLIERDASSDQEPPEVSPPTAKSDPCDADWPVSDAETHAAPIELDLSYDAERVEHGKLELYITLPDGDASPVTRHWTAVFTVNGAPLEGASYKVDYVKRGFATVSVPLPAVYSSHVRLLPPRVQ